MKNNLPLPDGCFAHWLSLFVATGLCLSLAAPARAVLDASWIGGAQGNYDNPANWSGGIVPDVWTSNGVTSALIDHPLGDVDIDITQAPHTLDTFAGDGSDVRINAQQNLHIRNELRRIQINLLNGKDLTLGPGAILNGATVTAVSNTPGVIPRVRFITNTADPIVFPITFAIFDTAPGATPLVVEAVGPGADDAVLQFTGFLNLAGSTQLNVATEVGTQGPAALSLSWGWSFSEVFTGTINAPITVGTDTPAVAGGRQGLLRIYGHSTQFGPQGKITLAPSSTLALTPRPRHHPRLPPPAKRPPRPAQHPARRQDLNQRLGDAQRVARLE